MIGLTTINGFPLPMDKRFKKIKEAGFDSILLWWGNDENESRHQRIELASKYNLIVENVHAQTDNLNSIWTNGEDGEEVISELINEIEDCSLYNISTIVMHLTNGSNPPPITPTGIQRVERLIDIAKKRNVRIAFENVRTATHTRYVLDNYQTTFVGLCYDSGHENFWTPEIDWLNLYRQRIFAIHLHDNKGDRDSHLIPYDGNIDWKTKLQELSRSTYQGSITIEAEYHHGFYQSDGFEGFLEKAYFIGLEIEKRMS